MIVFTFKTARILIHNYTVHRLSMSNTQENKNIQSNPSDSPEEKDESGFFYIIQTADVPLGVYKIGKSVRSDPNKRLSEYPKYSTVKYTIHVENADIFEDIVMRKFKSVFKRRMEFGIEYYEGDISQIINTAHDLWNKYGHLKTLKLDKTFEKYKPNGWQIFVNEWLAKNHEADVETAYSAYVDLLQNTFLTKEYAEFDAFATYFARTTEV